MLNTTIFDTVDALVAFIAALPVCADSVDVHVYDGYPLDLAAATVVTIGGTVNPTVSLTSTTVTMGAQSAEETFEVEGTISSFNGSTDQSSVRNVVKGVYEAIQMGLRQAMLPAGNKLGVTGLIFAEIVVVELHQTDEADVTSGRSATLTFKVKCASWI